MKYRKKMAPPSHVCSEGRGPAFLLVIVPVFIIPSVCCPLWWWSSSLQLVDIPGICCPWHSSSLLTVPGVCHPVICSLVFTVPSIYPLHYSLLQLYPQFTILEFVVLAVCCASCLSSPIHHCQHLQFCLWTVAHRWVGGACDMALVVADVVSVIMGLAGHCHCHVRAEPVATLQAEACKQQHGAWIRGGWCW